MVQDLVLFFSILMLIFLIAPLVAEKLKIPELVLLLIAGIFIGKNGFNLIPQSGEGAIDLFGKVGVLYIMFISGLETDANDFKRMAKKSAVFGTISFLIPQVLGTLVGRYLLGYGWVPSILLASMFASHTLIAYPIVSRLGISRNESVVVTVGGTIPTNTFSLLVLAVIADIWRNGGKLQGDFWIYIALGMVIMTFLIWYVLPIIAGWFFKNIPEKGGSQFLFVLGVVCLCAYGSQYARMEPIIGAFLAGVAFNRLIPQQSTLMNRLIFVGNTFFIPFFLISVGTLINPRLLVSSFSGLWVAVIMSVTVILTKYWASQISCKLFNYNSNDCKVMFGLSVAQAAATLAAVLVGYELKIFDDEFKILNGTIVMILISCAIGCYYVDRFGRKIMTTANTENSADEENNHQRIMVAVANPERAASLMQLSFFLRNKKIAGDIFPVKIIKEMEDDKLKNEIADSEKLLNSCVEQAVSLEMKVTPGIRLAANLSDGLVRTGKEYRADLLIFGWNKQVSLQSKIFGTLTDRLISECQARLLLCRLFNPLNVTQKVYLPIPEMGFRRPDLKNLIGDAKQLCSQIGAALHIIVSEEFPAESEEDFMALAPQCNLEWKKIKSWGKYESEFVKSLKADDLLIIPLDRRESVLWRPRFDRMAEEISEKYPDLNLLLAYPQIPQETEEIVNLKIKDKKKSNEKRAKVYATNLATETPEEAVRIMVQKLKLNTPYSYQNIEDGLIDAINFHPFELSENTVLLHTRSNYTQECMLLIGHSPKSYEIEKLNGKYNNIICLISPNDNDNDQHLQELAHLSRKFLDPEFASLMKAVKSAEEAVGIICKK
ncbi:MAG: cation:proton antiporter [Lentisphaeria bacterium]|nr:cation:proton antiporter [Lentisphaeria bacterium]